MSKTSRFVVAIAALIACLVIPAARAADDGSLNSKDAKFVRNATEGGIMEVELGKLAAEKATNSDVKMFGQHMVDDHSKANDQLKQLAASKQVDLTKTEEKAKKDSQKKIDKLSKLSGDAFDKAYIDDMVKDHEDDVKEFEKAAEVTQDQDLKTWAAKTLPTLQSHLQMAKDTQAKLKK